MQNVHADSPMRFVAQSLYSVAEYSFFAAKPGASLADWQEAKRAWDEFYRDDKTLDAEQRQIDTFRAVALAKGFRSVTLSESSHRQMLFMTSAQELFMTDASPSNGMAKQAWRDLTARPPSALPGIGMAMSAGTVIPPDSRSITFNHLPFSPSTLISNLCPS